MAVTPNYGWPVPVATDYVKDGWEAISDLGNAIDTTVAGLGTGLKLLTTSNPSASSGVSFTSLVVGKRYRLLANLSSSSSGAGLSFRFRENTTDKTTGYYGGGYQVNNVGGTTNLAWNNASVWDLNTLSSASNSANFVSADISIVSAAQALIHVQLYSVQTAYAAFQSANNNAMSNCNGFSLYPSTGTFTGTIKLYEYE